MNLVIQTKLDQKIRSAFLFFCELKTVILSAAQKHLIMLFCKLKRDHFCLSNLVLMSWRPALSYVAVSCCIMSQFGWTQWDDSLAFQEAPLFTIVGQCASETRCGSLDCLPLYSHNTDMVDLSKTRAWEGIQCQEAAERRSRCTPIQEIQV